MRETLRLTLAQLAPTLGDIAANAAKARDAWAAGKAAGANLVVLPEMFITGYQPQDLVMRPAFWREAMDAVTELAADTADGPALAIGAPFHDGRVLYNSYHILEGGASRLRVFKQVLPTTNVFDEKRTYAPGPDQGPFRLGPVLIGTPICEDVWWGDQVCTTMANAGAEVLVVPNGSPYHRDKVEVRKGHIRARIHETGLPMVYLNMLGGQDDQVFDGASFGVNPDGTIAFQLPQFEEVIAQVELVKEPEGWRIAPAAITPEPDAWEGDYHAMVMSLADYMAKTGFSKVLLGLSGGVDSALVAAIAADALGPDNVRCVMLPSEYTSQASLDDAAAVAKALGTRLDTLPISGPRAAVTEALAPLFQGTTPDLTEENIQSRLRALLLMALSNKFGEILLTTGNKSEVAVGYATIYGDMAGGYNPLKDLYKTRVFETCRWRNANHRSWMKAPAGEVIPPRVIDKPPSAELRDDQKDEDSLPPYELLDAILNGLIDREASVAELVAEGFDRATVKRVEHLIFISEYKRFQSAPGTRLTDRAFWLDRRYPIANRWRDKT
jgi:NAD+ synthase